MADEQDQTAEDQQTQGAGAEALDDAGTQDAGAQQDSGQQAEGGGGDEQQAAAADKPSLTADDIAAAIVKAGIGGQPKQEQQDEPAWTQEDFDNAFKVIKVTPQDVAMIRAALGEGGKDEDLIMVLQTLMQGSARQAATIANYQLKQLQQQLAAQIHPLRQYMSSQNEAVLRNEFFDKNKDLKPYEPLVDAIVQKVKESGFKGTKQQGFDYVAKQARAVIATLPNGKVAPGQQQTQQASAKPSKMSALSTGGGQGGAGRGVSGGKKSPGAAVFD